MGNHRSYKIKCLHPLGTRESKRQKVTALKLFHLTTSPSFKKSVFSDNTVFGERGLAYWRSEADSTG